MTIVSHYAASQAGITDSGSQTQENSIGPNCKHFFPCSAADVAASTLTDIVNGVVIDPVAETDHSVGAGADNTARVQSFGTNVGITGAWTAPGAKDCVLMVCGKSRIDSGSADVDDGGFITVYVGTAATQILRAQPYYSTFFSGATSDPSSIGLNLIATPMYLPNRTRVDGEDYCFAAVMRGDILEHWADGLLTGTNDVTKGPSTMQTDWDNFAPGAEFRCSHSAYCLDVMVCKASTGLTDPLDFPCTIGLVPQAIIRANGDSEVPGGFKLIPGNAAQTGEYPQDYYGFALFVFENGAPNDVGEAMNWMKEQWSAGNKVIWPGWSTLL